MRVKHTFRSPSSLLSVPLVVAVLLTHLLSIHLSRRNDGLHAVARQLESGRGLLVVVMMMMRLRSIGGRSCEDGREGGGDSFDLSPWEGRCCDSDAQMDRPRCLAADGMYVTVCIQPPSGGPRVSA
jgi:hypothetical protein